MNELDWHIFVPCAAASLFASFLAMIKNLHMFQLNFYKPMSHFRWIFRNAAKLWPHLFFLLFLLGCVFFGHVAMQVSFFVLSCFFCLFNKPIKNAKKPLKYTNRAKRMLAAFAVLAAGAVVLSIFLPQPHRLLPIGLLYVLSPIAPIAANAANAPIEAFVRHYYIADAKKMLKSHPGLVVVGITGSYGKTSVKYFLATLLKAKYNVLMTPESYNTPMGIVKTIRESLRPTHEIFVCEMGAHYRGEIKELCDIVLPKHGIITSIGEQHLETMKTMETIIKTKFELAEAVNGRGVIFLNGDNSFIMDNLPKQDLVTYGLNEKNDYRARDMKLTPNGTVFSLSLHGGGIQIENLQTSLIGEHNVANLAGAMAISSYLGVSHEDMRAQLKKIAPPPHRLQLSKNGDTLLIDDAYNSNPSGSEAALKALSLFEGCKILITPGMVGLGDRQYDLNHAFGQQAAKTCDFAILVGEKQTRPIYEGLVGANFEGSKIFIAETFDGAMKKAHGIESDGQKVILIENDLPDNY